MRTLLPLAPLVLLATLAGAQSPSGLRFARYSKPLRTLELDLATGTLTRGAQVQNRAATTVADFKNLDLGGFTGVDTGGGACEWFDAAIKGTGMGATQGVVNDSDLMNSIVFSYCSSRLSPGSGGPGGSVKLGFYEGYTSMGLTPTTTVAAFTLTGLPGNSLSTSFVTGFDCYFIRVIFDTLVCYADGAIGYSWRFLDTGTPASGQLAATWPFLACIASCSGFVNCATVDGQGMSAGFDRYCPPGNLLPTYFCFGTASGQFLSIGMEIEEVRDSTASVMGFNSSSNPNPDILSSSPAVVGQPWNGSLTLGLGRSKGGTWITYFGFSAVAPPSGVAIATFTAGLNFGPSKSGRMLLCNLETTGFSCSGTHSGVTGSTSACSAPPIPKVLGLVCNPWFAQALVLGPVPGAGNARLSSAVRGLIGTN